MTAEPVVMAWEDVLSSVPTKGAELKAYVDKGVVELRGLHDEERGRERKRKVLMATAKLDGLSSAVTIPDRDAKLLRALPRVPDVIYARVELDGKGTPRLMPARAPEPEESGDEKEPEESDAEKGAD